MNKPMPKCPYCGGIMTLCVDGYSDGTVTGAYYECIDCKADSPYIEDAGDADDMKNAAHAAAMQRWVEPNRVLTLEEVDALTEVDSVWKHNRYTDRIELMQGDDAAFSVNTEYIESSQRRENYGIRFVYWLRRPTDEERAGAKWEGNE